MSKTPMTHTIKYLSENIEGFDIINTYIRTLSNDDLIKCKELLLKSLSEIEIFADFLLFIFNYERTNVKHLVQRYNLECDRVIIICNDCYNLGNELKRDEKIKVVYKIKTVFIQFIVGENEIDNTKHFIYTYLEDYTHLYNKYEIVNMIDLINFYIVNSNSSFQMPDKKEIKENFDKFNKLWFN